MGIDAQIESLEKLVAVDAEIKDLSEQLGAVRGDIEGVRSTLVELEQQVGADRARVTDMEKTRNELHQDLRQIGGQIDRSRERLQRSRNEREVNAAEREMDELRKLQRDRDDEISKIVALLDQARASIVANEQKMAELTSRLDASAEGAESRMSELERQIAERLEQRKAIAARLPSLTARRYESMHQRGKVPVARTTNGTCLGCYVQLPPMLMHSLLARSQFGECPNCHRIIYYHPPQEAAEAEEKADESKAAGEGGEATSPEQASS